VSVVSVAVSAAAAGAIVSSAVNGLRKLSAARAFALPTLILFAGRPRRPGVTLTERSPSSSRRGVLDELAADERAREFTFRRKQMVRVRRDLPRALRHSTERRRVNAVSGIVRREWHYNRLRQDAIAVRAAGMADSLNVEEVSPAGTRWELGPTTLHSAGCVYLHLRCGCVLRGIADGTSVPSIEETLALLAEAVRLEAA